MALFGRHAKRRAMRGIPTPDVSFASATGLPAVYLRGGSLEADGKSMFSDILLTISRGEVVSVVGPSAEELRALLRCLVLLDRLDDGVLAYGALQVTTRAESGKISYDEKALRDARGRFGLVSEGLDLFPHFTVMRNICDAPVAVQRRARDEVEEAARALLARYELESCADSYPAELTSWQRFCVAVCRAQIRRPKLIYFGDVARALEPGLVPAAFELMRGIAEGGVGVGAFTSAAGNAAKASDRMALLMDGRIVDAGTPQELMRDPQDEQARAYLAEEERRTLRSTLNSKVLL